jgi:peptidoglycan/LPS O-acetylase OafA/YrhL/lysophospholipase L1-like esterase
MSRPQDKRIPYLPGIDALRALAVLAVFLYHAGVGWMPGGFLGVDLFFVISGYLITSLLVSEYRRGGHIRLGQFWLRRAKRLLPAVGVFIAVTMVVAAIVTPEDIAGLRGDAVSSLFYVANWNFVFEHQSYFDQFQRPSLFRHLWSLSVEEQFYLLWPLVFAAGMTLFGRRRLLAGVIAGALASVLLAWILFDQGGDNSRLYYGTDTHAVGLLAGVALALVWSPLGVRRRSAGRLVGPTLDAIGVLALGYIVLSFVHVHDYDLGLYHGGYLSLAIVTAILLAVLAHPAARLGKLIGRPPVLWLGLRSYSFYLWHWPVLVLTRPGVDVSMPRGILIPLQLLVVLALADLSYRFVELPFRGKTKMPRLPEDWLRVGRPALLVAVPAVVILVGWSGLVATGPRHLQPGLAAASTASFARVNVSEPSRQDPKSGRDGSHGSGTPARSPRIVAFGDSVMIGAKERLAARLGPRSGALFGHMTDKAPEAHLGFSMNAKVSRQADEFIALARRLQATGAHPDALVIQMGNNGPLYSDEMEELRKATSNAKEIFLINDHAPVDWIEQSNDQLAEAAEVWPHTTLVDWASVAKSHDNLTWDGIHLTPAGAGVYTRLIAAAIRAESR